MDYYLLHTTYPILLVSVFARQLCLPVPAVLFLLSGGALAGTGRLSVVGILAVAVLGCLLGDLIWFEAGRRRGKRVLKLLCALASDPSLCIRRSRTTFAQRGLPILLVAKFVPGLDGITPPLAGMAGASHFSFLAYDAGGSALWASAYIGAGFLFAEELERVARSVSVVANMAVLVFGVPILILFVWKLIEVAHMIRRIQPLHIEPHQLKERLDAGQRIALVDLQRFEDDAQDQHSIPGAMRANPIEMRRKRKVSVPADVDLVLYCASRNCFVSARVAAVMRKRGAERIWVLNGGLKRWRDEGFPLSSGFANAVEEMKRLGIEMAPPLDPLAVADSPATAS